MTTKYVVDVHTLVWFLENNQRLGINARAVMQDSDSTLILPATVLAEACWIVDSGRTSIPSSSDLLAAVDSDPRLILFPLNRAVIEKSRGLTAIEKMQDRQTVATALLLSERGETVALLTCNANIVASSLRPIVW